MRVGLPAVWLKTAAQADAEVVGADGQMAGRFGRPERATAQSLQAKLGAEFLDAIFDVGPAVVAAPDVQGADRGGRLLAGLIWVMAQTEDYCPIPTPQFDGMNHTSAPTAVTYGQYISTGGR